MINTMLPALRRAAALGILALLPVVLWFAVAGPLIELIVDRQNEIEVASDRLANLEAMIRRIPVLREREAANKGRLEAAGGIWTEASEAVIAATMQDLLRQAVAGSKGIVKSASHLQGKVDKDLQTVRIRFSIEGTLATVQQTLAAVQGARPAMFVDSMTIKSPSTFSTDTPPLLGLDLEVVGYMHKAPTP